MHHYIIKHAAIPFRTLHPQAMPSVAAIFRTGRRCLGILALPAMLLSSCSNHMSGAQRAFVKTAKKSGIAVAAWQDPGASTGTWQMGPASLMKRNMSRFVRHDGSGSIYINFATLQANGSGELRLAGTGTHKDFPKGVTIKIVFSVHGMHLLQVDGSGRDPVLDLINPRGIGQDTQLKSANRPVIVFEGDFKVYHIKTNGTTLVAHSKQAYDYAGPQNFVGERTVALMIPPDGVQLREGIRIGGIVPVVGLPIHK